MSTLAEVILWGRRIGAVELPDDQDVAVFEYAPAFARSRIEISPIKMPLQTGRRYTFPGLARQSFRGLPGLLSDSLPDRYGNALIDAWLATQGRDPEDFNAVERLCYIGKRGMGALEFRPALGPRATPSHTIDVEALVELAAEVLKGRSRLAVSFDEPKRERALREILRVGSSAGGARPKALIALNPETNEARSGQLELDPGFEHWILKFDGVDDKTRELGTALGYGAIEWVYSQMAKRAGIEMQKCRILESGGRRHFMTRRFDRLDDGAKVHMQSLAALAHLDYNQAGTHSYEQAFQVMRQLELDMVAIEQQFRRMVFNIVARNQDDHVKNIAFLMNQRGMWHLAPAFDLTLAYNPAGVWTAQHQMSANGKRNNFTVEDLRQVAGVAAIKRGRAEEIMGEVVEAVKQWVELATAAKIEADRIEAIERMHRLTAFR